MAEILYAPNAERVVSTNAWAFLHWLRTLLRVACNGWEGLQAWSAQEPDAFEEAILTFAGTFRAPSSLRCEPPGRIWGLADWLLFADMRPNDQLMVVDGAETGLFDRAGGQDASVLIAPARTLAASAFRRPHRPNLANLRTIIATGDPMSPEARRRIYTWVKADVMLLACAGSTYWGNPLEPVLAAPRATPAFLTPRPSARPPR